MLQVNLFGGNQDCAIDTCCTLDKKDTNKSGFGDEYMLHLTWKLRIEWSIHVAIKTWVNSPEGYPASHEGISGIAENIVKTQLFWIMFSGKIVFPFWGFIWKILLKRLEKTSSYVHCTDPCLTKKHGDSPTPLAWALFTFANAPFSKNSRSLRTKTTNQRQRSPISAACAQKQSPICTFPQPAHKYDPPRGP